MARRSFTGRRISELFALEIFSGTAGITCQLRRIGLLSSFGIDQLRTKDCPSPVIVLDVRKTEVQQLILSFVAMETLCFVWLGPPCGTASRVRDIPMSGHPGSGPPPLRSVAEPDGVADVPQMFRARLLAANELYSFTAQVCIDCAERGVAFVVENPRRSFFWLTSFWSRVHEHCKGQIVYPAHHACMYGSRRMKSTMLASNRREFLRISATCDASHEHEPWGLEKSGKFATAAEVHYPLGLCRAVSLVVHDMLLADGAEEMEHATSPWSLQLNLNQSLRHVTGKQSRKLHAQLHVPLYKLELTGSGPVAVLPFRTLETSDLARDWTPNPQVCLQPCCDLVPAGSRVLHCFSFAKGDEANNGNIRMVVDDAPTPLPTSDQAFFKIGVHWTDEEFVQQAVALGHPADCEVVLPEALLSAMRAHVEFTPDVIAKQRLTWAQKWTRRAAELKQDEKSLHNELDPNIADIVRNKRILLFNEMLAEIDYPDEKVSAILTEGVDLVGDTPSSRVFPPQMKPQCTTVSALRGMAPAVRAIVDAQTRACAKDPSAKIVWKDCLGEVDRGWLQGPFHELEKGVLVSRRFGLVQKDKVRMVDDLSQSQINSCVTVTEKPQVFSLDVIAALLVWWLRNAGRHSQPSQLTGKTFDLKSAYKQLPLSHTAAEWAFLSVWDTDSDSIAYFKALVAPFGSIMSVHAFLRLSLAIWTLGAQQLWLMWSVYFDDFPLFSTPCLETSADQSARMLFDILGWVYAKEGHKNTTFSKEVTGLGIILRLQFMNEGRVEVCNTEARISELKEVVHEVLEKKSLGKAQALQLHGRLLFSCQQLFGRLGKSALQVLSHFAYHASSHNVGHEALQVLRKLLELLESGKPRILRSWSSETWHIFTDAALEQNSGFFGVGGVLVDSAGMAVAFFGEEVDRSLLRALEWDPSAKIIFGGEMLAVAIALTVWGEVIANRLVTIYTDNEGVKFALIRGSTAAGYVQVLLDFILQMEVEISTALWISRVPTKSNVSDAPSRGDFQFLQKLGSTQVPVPWQSLQKSLSASSNGKMGAKA